MDKLTHKTLGEYSIEPELKHRHVENFFEALRDKETGKHSGVYSDRVIIESAVEAKILLDKIDVMDCKPAVTNWLAAEVIAYVNKSREIPKN